MRREEDKIGRAPAATPGGPAYRPHGPGRRNEEISRMRKISTQISAVDIGLYSLEGWIEVNGKKVTEVEVGQKFDIKAKYTLENVGGLTWLSCVTVKGNGIENYEDTKASVEKLIHTATLDNMGANIMPDSDINLSFKLWIHDSYWESPAYPPKELW